MKNNLRVATHNDIGDIYINIYKVKFLYDMILKSPPVRYRSQNIIIEPFPGWSL